MLPEDMVDSDTITMFNKHLDRYLKRQDKDMVLMWANGICVDWSKKVSLDVQTEGPVSVL